MLKKLMSSWLTSDSAKYCIKHDILILAILADNEDIFIFFTSFANSKEPFIYPMVKVLKSTG